MSAASAGDVTTGRGSAAQVKRDKQRELEKNVNRKPTYDKRIVGAVPVGTLCATVE